VAAIKDYSRMSRDQLKPTRPARRPKPFTHCFVADVVENMRSSDRESCIRGLVIANQWQT
jgi:hypothetical protein